MAIVVYVEQSAGKIKKTSLEAVSYGYALAAQTHRGYGSYAVDLWTMQNATCLDGHSMNFAQPTWLWVGE